MDTFTDYYTVLGVDSHASASTIKGAFKKLALKYHPDVYNGPDAQERMRDLLIAYQTLSDPASRRNYDVQRAEYLLDTSGMTQDEKQRARTAGSYRSGTQNAGMPTRVTRRDDRRTYAFPDLNTSPPTQIKLNLGDVSYELTDGNQPRPQQNLALSVLRVKPAIGQNTCSYAVFIVMPSSKVRRFAIRSLVGANSIILTNSSLFAQIADARNGALLRMLVLTPYVLPVPVGEQFCG